jgi:hypothetical protein
MIAEDFFLMEEKRLMRARIFRDHGILACAKRASGWCELGLGGAAVRKKRP